MAFMGLGELVVVLVLLGGAMPGTAADLQAPHDSAKQSLRYVLPDAGVAMHANVEASVEGMFSLLGEVEKLRLVQNSQEASQAMSRLRLMLDQGLQESVTAIGMDLRRDIGSVTISISFRPDETMEVLARARGNFGKSKLPAVLAESSKGTVEHRGVTLYQAAADREVPNVVVCFPDGQTLLAGTRDKVEAILDQGDLKGGKGGTRKQLMKQVSASTESFVYLSLPDWVVQEMRKDQDLVRVADFFQDMDYLLIASTGKEGTVLFQGASQTSARRAFYLLRATEAAVAMLENAVDASIYGMLGILPLVSPVELDPQIYELASDEEGMLELGEWLKKRFTGKSKATLDKSRHTARLVLDNPASVLGLTLPMMGAGWAYFAMAASPLKEEPKREMKPEAPMPEPMKEPQVR